MTKTVSISIDTTTIFHLDKPVTVLPTCAWGKTEVEAFSVGRQLGTSTGYEALLWHHVGGELVAVERTRKHIAIDETDVTMTFGGKSYVVGAVV